jgi:hypothetical protein
MTKQAYQDSIICDLFSHVMPGFDPVCSELIRRLEGQSLLAKEHVRVRAPTVLFCDCAEVIEGYAHEI